MTRTHTVPHFEIKISTVLDDAEWDEFVANTPGGHHVQSSLWAKLKSSINWRAARVILMQQGRIVAGAQLLIRSLPTLGGIGYVPKGPLVAVNDESAPHIVDGVIEGLYQLAKAERLHYIAVQPTSQCIADVFSRRGFRGCSVSFAQPTATVLIDLRPDIDQILAGMKSKTRYNIRYGMRKGITVREGDSTDLPLMYQLLKATGERKEFSLNSLEYFENLWRIFSPQDCLRLFIAEYQGEPVSTLLAIGYGDTVTYKRGGWSGKYGTYYPNEAVQWAAMQWAKAAGYTYYDLEGISRKAAIVWLKTQQLPEHMQDSVTRFKLGFGGEVTLLPQVSEHIYNPLLRFGYYNILPSLSRRANLKQIAHRLIGRV